MDKPKNPRQIMLASSRCAALRIPAAPAPSAPDPEDEYDYDADEIDPEEEAAKIWPVYRDDLGFPVEYKKEMSVSIFHIREAFGIFSLLEQYFKDLGVVATVAAEWPVAYDPLTRPLRTIAPDVMVIKGLDVSSEFEMAKERKKKEGTYRSYRTWEHGGKAPDWALEIASKETWKNDLSRTPHKGKLARYSALGVAEYVFFDQEGLSGGPPLKMWHPQGRALKEVAPKSNGRFWSASLELELGVEEASGLLRLCFYRADGTRLLRQGELLDLERRRVVEADQRAEEERSRAEEERSRAEDADRRAQEEKRRAKEERSRAEEERSRAEDADRRAQEEKHRAEQERRRAEDADRRAQEEKHRAEQERLRAEDADRRAEELARRLADLERLLAASSPDHQ